MAPGPFSARECKTICPPSFLPSGLIRYLFKRRANKHTRSLWSREKLFTFNKGKNLSAACVYTFNRRAYSWACFLIKLHTSLQAASKKNSQPFHLLARQQSMQIASHYHQSHALFAPCAHKRQSVSTFGQSISHGCHTLSVRL